jgi:Ca-activated chloride channel family protein
VASRSLSLAAGVLVGVAGVFGATQLPTPKPAIDQTNCITVVTSSSTEKGDLIAQLAAKYNGAGRGVHGRCVRVDARKLTSGKAMAQLVAGWKAPVDGQPPPDVWLPSSSLWLDQLKEETAKSPLIASGFGTSITKSPLVIALPKVMAAQLTRSNRDVTWADLRTLANEGWAAFDRPEWGRFLMGKDNPHLSTSGLAATIATYAAAIKQDGRKGYDDAALQDADVVSFVKGVESSVAHYDDDSVVFLGGLYARDQRKESSGYISAMVMQEQMAYLYNSGAPTGNPADLGKNPAPNEPLVAIHPRDGTMMIDHPFAVMSTTPTEKRDAAKDFHDFLLAPEQQKEFTRLGFRDSKGQADAKLLDSVSSPANSPFSLLQTPSAAAVKKMLQGWDNHRRRGKVLLVLDVSGSMGDPDDPAATNQTSRLELLKPAAQRALDLLDDDDEVGLWTFSSNPNYTEVVPSGRVGAVRDTVKAKIAELKPLGATALYATTVAAQQKMLENLDRTKINAIVLLSDGKDEPGTGLTREQMIAEVTARQLDTSVRIFTIPFGKEADVETLAMIAKASEAEEYNATNPVDIDEVFVKVFSHFSRG